MSVLEVNLFNILHTGHQAAQGKKVLNRLNVATTDAF